MSGIRYSRLKKKDDLYIEQQCPRCKSSNKIKLDENVIFKKPVDAFRCFSCKKVSWISEIKEIGGDKEILHILGYESPNEIIVVDGEEIEASLTHQIYNIFSEYMNGEEED